MANSMDTTKRPRWSTRPSSIPPYSHETLVSALSYDPTSGLFTWRAAICKKTVVGREAGSRTASGHIQIGAFGKHAFAHRLAWFYVTGEWPMMVDHIDGNPANNRFENLRPATKSQNAANSKKQRSRTSQLKGVSWHVAGKKWQAHICVDGKNIYLGLHDTEEGAHAAYRDASRALFGDFARQS